MGLRTVSAVVSRTMRMTGSSKMVTLITDRHGLVKAMAKGARRPRSKYGAALEPVTLIDCTYYYKNTRDIQTLSEADIVDPYSGLKSDIRLFSIASCMAEIAQSLTAREDPSAGTYPVLVEALDGLKGSTPRDAEKHLWRFVLRFMAAMGYEPRLDRCMVCGKTPRGKAAFFSFADGGVVCRCTDPGGRFGMEVSPGALMVMNELMHSDAAGIPRIRLGRAQRLEVEDAALKFLAYHLGYSRPPRALAFLRKIEGKD